jgi:segregation and condensation protein A
MCLVDTPVETTGYTVRTAAFEGPLELLLSLVEGRKLFINEISLAAVTDDFIANLRSMGGAGLTVMTSFLSVAATLILIKSRSLLPGFLVTKEEEKDIQDLESRLALYSMMREVSEQLSVRYGTKIIRLPPERELFTSVFAPDPKLTAGALMLAAHECLNRVPKEEASLTERVAAAASISFRQWQQSVVGEDREALKSNVIVSFLAMLELVRQGIMDALQNTDFEDIELSAVPKDADSAIV